MSLTNWVQPSTITHLIYNNWCIAKLLWKKSRALIRMCKYMNIDRLIWVIGFTELKRLQNRTS